MPAFLSTQPPANFNWQITLKDKVIAITGVSAMFSLANLIIAFSACQPYQPTPRLIVTPIHANAPRPKTNLGSFD